MYDTKHIEEILKESRLQEQKARFEERERILRIIHPTPPIRIWYSIRISLNCPQSAHVLLPLHERNHLVPLGLN